MTVRYVHGPYTDDEDAFMQVLRRAIDEEPNTIEELWTEWLTEVEPSMWPRFVEEILYDRRDELMGIYAEEIGLDRIERAWDLMNVHEEDFAEAYSKWVRDNTGGKGIGYPKPVGDGAYALWDDFVTDYGTRHKDEILTKYLGPGKGASGNRKPAAQKKSATRKPAAKARTAPAKRTAAKGASGTSKAKKAATGRPGAKRKTGARR